SPAQSLPRLPRSTAGSGLPCAKDGSGPSSRTCGASADGASACRRPRRSCTVACPCRSLAALRARQESSELAEELLGPGIDAAGQLDLHRAVEGAPAVAPPPRPG